MLRRVALAICIGLLVMLVTHGLLLPQRTVDPSKYRFMHCSECGREMTYSAKLAGKQCAQCLSKTAHYVPTVESVGQGHHVPDSMKRYVFAMSVEGVGLLAAVVYLLSHPQRNRKSTVYLYCQCKKCKRRLRYRARAAGSKGICPRCNWEVAFPLPVGEAREGAG